jgi:reactive intermediate/imine deaminase
MEKQIINPARLCKPHATYSHAVKVKAGHLLFIKGETARDKDFNLIGKGDVIAQSRQIFENIKVILEEAGGSFDNVVKIVTYVTDIGAISALQAVRSEYFKSGYPVTTMVEVSRLATPDLLVEIEAIAVLD